MAVASSSASKTLRLRARNGFMAQDDNGGNKNAAAALGKLIAQRAIEKGIKEVALDCREYKYHGRVAALADAAREAGLVL